MNLAYTPAAAYIEEGGVWTDKEDPSMSCLCNCQCIFFICGNKIYVYITLFKVTSIYMSDH